MNDLFIKNINEIQRIEMSEIFYFTKCKHKTIAVTKDSSIEINNSLYSISALLEKNTMFFRTHKSYIVNIHKIQHISKFNNRTYNIKFKGIEDTVYCTQKNLNILTKRILIL